MLWKVLFLMKCRHLIVWPVPLIKLDGARTFLCFRCRGACFLSTSRLSLSHRELLAGALTPRLLYEFFFSFSPF